MSQSDNFILASLSEAERDRLLNRAERRRLTFGDTLYEPERAVTHVHFPEQGVISIITEAANGEGAEGGVTGAEGAAGLPEALGSGVMRSRGVDQADGWAWCVPADACLALHQTSDAFRRAVSQAAEFQVVEARQSLLCRSYHSTEQRMARWLLEMADRGNAPSRTLPMTQEILGVMLAVQRTTVTAAAQRLRQDGLISYARGKMHLLDVEGLERAACACRGTVREAQAHILGRPQVWSAQFLEPVAAPPGRKARTTAPHN